MKPHETLEAFDRYLAERELRLEVIVIGGAALNLLGVVARVTKDVDILDPILDERIRSAAAAFAQEQRSLGLQLSDDWLNNGPIALVNNLEPGWRERLQPAFSASHIRMQCLGRHDLLCSKLFALCDRGFDLADCIALAPTTDELAQVLPWLQLQDINPDWPRHVRATFDDLARRLHHGV